MRRFFYVFFFLFSADYYRLISFVSAKNSNVEFNLEGENLIPDNQYSQNFIADSPNILEKLDDGLIQNSDDEQKNVDELQKIVNKLKKLEANKKRADDDGILLDEDVEEIDHETLTKNDKPLTAQKKGQSEFVEFVEPLKNKELKNVEFLSKRVPAGDLTSQNDKISFIPTSGNIIFISFIAACCVLSLIGIVGGIYYYNHIRKSNEDPFDDFTRYSPAGPGHNRFKKNLNERGNNIDNNLQSEGVGNKGDESLAYKAQLHHYQQTKQKIIGGDSDTIGWRRNVMLEGANSSEKSDEDEEDGDLEHNFSVYECPGLAPTGDIEVQNPNFVDHNVK